MSETCQGGVVSFIVINDVMGGDEMNDRYLLVVSFDSSNSGETYSGVPTNVLARSPMREI